MPVIRHPGFPSVYCVVNRPHELNVDSMKHYPVFILIAFLTVHAPCPAQPGNDDTVRGTETSRIDMPRLLAVGAASAVVVTIAHIQNYNSWWKGTSGPFHAAVDDAPPLGADKCGHFLFSYYVADILGGSMRWSGIDSLRAALYGSLFAFTLQLYVEIEDGFHPNLGFSFGDLAANTLGSSYALVQERYPLLRSISPKWSFSPSTRYLHHDYRTIFDDYESQNYWLSFNIAGLTGNRILSFLPFLNVAVGYGVTNLDLKGNGDREIYLSLDIDMTKLPGDGELLHSIKHLLNYFHFPAPTIRLTPTVIAYGLRF